MNKQIMIVQVSREGGERSKQNALDNLGKTAISVMEALQLLDIANILLILHIMPEAQKTIKDRGRG
jgi:hypothetical protein